MVAPLLMRLGPPRLPVLWALLRAAPGRTIIRYLIPWVIGGVMFLFKKRPDGASSPPSSPPAPFAPIGVVRSPLRRQGLPVDPKTAAEVVLRDDLAPALAGLKDFGRITVVFWMDQVSEEGRSLRQLRPGGLAAMPLVGVFATRTQNRPNPIGVTTVELLGVAHTCLRVRGLDALDGSPVLDVRPYLPPYDAFPDATMPPWVWGTNSDRSNP